MEHREQVLFFITHIGEVQLSKLSAVDRLIARTLVGESAVLLKNEHIISGERNVGLQ